MKNQIEKHIAAAERFDGFLTDAGREALHAEIERLRIAEWAKNLHSEQRICMSALGERGIAAGIGDGGTIIDIDASSKFVRVLMDSSNVPEWVCTEQIFIG